MLTGLDGLPVLPRQRAGADLAFREDGWDGMDYEVGTGALPWKYWQAVEAGHHPAPPRKDNPLFEVLKREFAPAP